MRAAFGPFGRRLARQLSPRGVVAESSSSEMSEAVSGACSQAVQERGFHSAVWRPRASSAWSSQHERTSNISSSCSSLAATAAWQASVNAPESAMVEDWLTALHQVDTEARSLATGLLARHPTLLWKDCQRVVGVVQALVDAMRQRHLLRPYVVQDAHILAMVDRYTPEGLRARLSEQHRLVWQKLDDNNVASLFASRTSLDMVDLDAKALALKAQALRALIPEFLPSTVLRGCPELLDVQVDDLPAYIRRVGDVVVVGKKVHAELVAPSNVVIIHSTVPVAPAASTSAPSSPSASATAGRLLRTARCGAQQLLKEQSRAVPESRTVTRVFCNSRQLVFADGDSIEARVEDPTRSQEDLSAACRLAVVQRVSIAGQAAAGVRA